MAFDFTCFATVQANRRSASSAAVGARRVTILQVALAEPRAVAVLHQEAARHLPPGERRRAGIGQAAGDEQPQVPLRARREPPPPRSRAGAITTSVKISTIAAAVSASSSRFSATMPPNAEVRSQS